MAERPKKYLKTAYIVEHSVKFSAVVRKGFAVKNDSGDVIETVAVTDNAFGIALDAGTSPASGTKVKIRVAYFGHPGVVEALVGTAGATAFAPAKWASDGNIDATVGGGTGKLRVHGQFLETGVVGDLVALNLADAAWTVGS